MIGITLLSYLHCVVGVHIHKVQVLIEERLSIPLNSHNIQVYNHASNHYFCLSFVLTRHIMFDSKILNADDAKSLTSVG